MAGQLKDGAIRLRGLLLDKSIPEGTLDPVLAQCKELYLKLDDISSAPAANDLEGEDLEILKTMKNTVLAFHKELWKLMTITDQLTSTSAALDQVLLRDQRTDIVQLLLGQISTYTMLLPVFDVMAGRQLPASPEVGGQAPGAVAG
jgi:hypothetical protein